MDNFYTTEPYKEARQKAEIDIDNWPTSPDTLAELQERYYRNRVKKENRAVLGLLCLGLTLAIFIIWLGTYAYVSNVAHTQAPSIAHKSSGL